MSGELPRRKSRLPDHLRICTSPTLAVRATTRIRGSPPTEPENYYTRLARPRATAEAGTYEVLRRRRPQTSLPTQAGTRVLPTRCVEAFARGPFPQLSGWELAKATCRYPELSSCDSVSGPV